MFDIAIDTGARRLTSGKLENGAGRLAVVPLTVLQDTPPLEVRTFPGLGGHIRIESLTMTRGGASEKACRAG